MEKSQFNSIYKDKYKKSTGLLFIRTYHKWHGLVKNKLRTINLTHPQFVVLSLPPLRKSLTKSVLRHISTIITLSQLCSRAVATVVIFQYSPRVK